MRIAVRSLTVGGSVLSVMLMIQATTEGNAWMQRWALFVGMATFVPIIKWLVDHSMAQALADERRRTEELVESVAQEFARSELGEARGRRR